MSDIYLTNGTNIGRLLAVIVVGSTPTLVLERMDTKTLITAPIGPGISVVEVCTLCRYRAKQTDPATGQVISDLCAQDQAAQTQHLALVEAARLAHTTATESE